MSEAKPLATAETMNQSFTGTPTAPITLVNSVAITQKQLLQLQLSAQILSGVIVGNDVLWCKDPDAGYIDEEEMVDKALKCADLLLKKVTETESSVYQEPVTKNSHLLTLASASFDPSKIKSIEWKLAEGVRINLNATNANDLTHIQLFKHSRSYDTILQSSSDT